MTKLLQQALDALIESRDDVDLCYAGVKAARLSFRQERQLGFYEEQLVKHDAAIEGLKQALAQQEQCGCREGECETKKDKTCRMTIEIAERDGIPEWTPAIGIECAISSLRDDAARLRDGSYTPLQIADDLDVIANDLAKCKPDAQQEQPASVDAYVGAREDAAIWKKRALEAEELNRKFIAELNGPTYLGEPVKQEQPAQGKCKCGHVGTSITVVESFPVHSVSVDEEDPDYKEHYHGLDVDATLQIGLEICRNCKTINGFWIEDTGGAEFYADWGKPRYTHPAPTQPAQEPVGRFVKATYGDYGELAWHPSYVAKIGDCLYTHPAPTQPAQKPDLWKTQFLTDVMTSAGLLMHGRTDKKLAQRIADGSARWRTELYASAPTQPALSDEQLIEIAKPFISSMGDHWCHEDGIRDNGTIEEFAKAVIEAHCRGGVDK